MIGERVVSGVEVSQRVGKVELVGGWEDVARGWVCGGPEAGHSLDACARACQSDSPPDYHQGGSGSSAVTLPRDIECNGAWKMSPFLGWSAAGMGIILRPLTGTLPSQGF